MFYKVKNTFLMLLLMLIMPLNILAYSDYIIASGENIGIKLNSNGVLIVGTYKVNNMDPGSDAGLKIGDVITKIDNVEINSIEDMVNAVNASDDGNIKIYYLRKDKENSTNLNLVQDNNALKTGLYVKDSIMGVGTLTFIDPETKKFGALGHEIIESTTGNILDISSGSIFSSNVTGITKSNDGVPGEKNATFDSSKIDGEVDKNTNKGIFGDYISNIDKNNLYKVATSNEVKKGKAHILTVLDDNNVDEYSINITKISDTADNIKNIVFEITDEKLISKTNGIVQGMSGSPIIQGEYIIGAVTHVFVDNPLKGYGIFITNMLEEAEK